MEFLGTDKPINKVQPIVSVCITTYNHARFIAECLDSMLMQEADFPFEIIVGEDDSKDGTREICKEYAEKFPDKIRLFLRDEKDKIFINGRKTGRFNFIENLKAARGQYIALCDGDDYWLVKNKLQKQITVLDSNCDLSFTASNVLRKKINEEALFPGYKKSAVFGKKDFIKRKWFVPTASIVFRREMIDMNYVIKNMLKTSGMDIFIQVLLLQKGRLHFSPEALAVYRIHSGGLSQQNSTNINDRLFRIRQFDFLESLLRGPKVFKHSPYHWEYRFLLAKDYAARGLKYYGHALFYFSASFMYTLRSRNPNHIKKFFQWVIH